MKKILVVLSFAAVVLTAACGALGEESSPTVTPEERAEQTVQDLRGPAKGFDKTPVFLGVRGEEAYAEIRELAQEVLVPLVAQFAKHEGDGEPVPFQQVFLWGVPCGNELAVPNPFQAVNTSLIGENEELSGVLVFMGDTMVDLENAVRTGDGGNFLIVPLPGSGGIAPLPGQGCGFAVGDHRNLRVLDFVFTMDDLFFDPGDPNNEVVVVGNNGGVVSGMNAERTMWLATFDHAPVSLGAPVVALQDGFPKVVGMVAAVFSTRDVARVISVGTLFPNTASP